MIREMAAADLEALKDVYYHTRRHAFYWLQPDEMHIDDFTRDTDGERIWVAESSGQIIGFVSVWEPENFIHHLYVLPKFAGKQIGTRLLDVCMENIGRPALLKCMSENTKALKFYRSRGWQAIGVGVGREGEYQLMQAK